jgi:hypothetical protein
MNGLNMIQYYTINSSSLLKKMGILDWQENLVTLYFYISMKLNIGKVNNY